MNKVKTLVKGVPEDRETWFSYIKPSSRIQEHVVQYQKVDMTFAENESGIEGKTVIVNETFVDAEDSGKNSECTSRQGEKSEDAQKHNLEYSEEESSKPEPGKYNCDDPGIGDAKDEMKGDEKAPEDQKEEHSGE